jgi:hypothetical protein
MGAGIFIVAVIFISLAFDCAAAQQRCITMARRALPFVGWQDWSASLSPRPGPFRALRGGLGPPRLLFVTVPYLIRAMVAAIGVPRRTEEFSLSGYKTSAFEERRFVAGR